VDVLAMKVLRGLGAAVVWVLATVVMLLAAVLCVTLVGLPLGIPLGALGFRLYVYGVQLMVPSRREVKHKIRKSLGVRHKTSKRLGLRRQHWLKR
jgi:hypothetical protein